MNEDSKQGPRAWRSWIDFYPVSPLDSPYAWELVEIWREGWDEIEVVDPRELHPMFNVHGLYWRPC